MNTFYLTSYFLLLFFSNFLLSQTINFDKEYGNLGLNTKGYIVEQTLEEGYITGGRIGSNLLIAQMDSLGNFEFQREIEQSNEYPLLRTFPIHTIPGGGFILTTGIVNNTETEIFISKLDAEGNTLWGKSYPHSQSVFGSDIVETIGGDLIAIGTISRSAAFLVKTDSIGNLLWSKEYTFRPISSLLVGPSITNLIDGNILIGNGREIEKISTDGDSLWHVNVGFKISSIKSTSDGKIIVAGYKKYSKLNLAGNIEWEKDISITLDCVDNSSDDGYIFLGHNDEINKTDSLGEILWQKEIVGFGNYISLTNDGGYIVTGNYFDNLRLLKTDESGEFAAVYISNPNSYCVLPIFKYFAIEWYSNGIDNVDIHYSIDEGINWLEIISDYQADSNKYDWYVPNTPSNNCILRISDSYNSDIYHILDTTFTIMLEQNYDYISVNEIFMWLGNDGMGSHNPISDNSGFYWPGGENAVMPSIFADGLVWGGKVNDEIRVNGDTYRYGLKPGKILENGQSDDPNQGKYKIFKINKNWETLPEGPIKDRLEYDYNNWPGDLGAPYNDINGDGSFTKDTDTPKFVGDEVLFYVANDMDSAQTKFTYGSLPIGLEFQTTVWGFSRTDYLKDAVFKSYRIINKSGNQIDSFYLGYWADDDLGYAVDDYSGCDSALSLAYTYNGDNNDQDYYGENPPAVGHLLLQGPITSYEGFDNTKYQDRWLPNNNNLPLTAFTFYTGSAGFLFEDPQMGTLLGTSEFYNNMQGLLGNGQPTIDPATSDTTQMALAGDPVNGAGWYEGNGWLSGPPPGDRRSLMASGPFTMAPGDTQEVVYAIFMARGSDNIQSVAELKKTAVLLHQFWGNEIPTDVSEENESTPKRFSLSQNYPNPFNPGTTIKYTIPSNGKSETTNGMSVQLKVFDILGREVTTLVNQKQKPGSYEIVFDASKYASGIYFYKLKSGDFVQVKKMMLLK